MTDESIKLEKRKIEAEKLAMSKTLEDIEKEVSILSYMHLINFVLMVLQVQQSFSILYLTLIIALA